jgi:quinone-modifying oxidoreductase subunit QmoC
MTETNILLPDIEFIREIKSAGGDTLKRCFQCATCSTVCSLSPNEKAFPRKEMLWANWGLKDRLLTDADIWLCHQCYDCSVKCPREAKPSEVLTAVRSYIFKSYAYPKLIGKALAKKDYLLLLLLIPALLLLLFLLAIHNCRFDFLQDEVVEYSQFFPHKYLEPLFMGGNFLIFVFAGIGLFRFWKGLNSGLPKGQKVKLLPTVLQTMLDILTHRRFQKCEQNRLRFIAHFLVFYGFIGAMITAGLAVLLTTLIPVMPSPIELPNPVKILGVGSGLAMIIGASIMIYRRLKNRSQIGESAYTDWAFLNMLFLTALSGMLTYIARLLNIAPLAYTIYFIHLTIVFWVLWYAPYSKFAHIFYRSLAMFWAKSIKRI